MSDKSAIEWTDATWNPIVGCSIVSPGCTNCYAMKMAARIERMGSGPHYAGTTQQSKAGSVWTGKVELSPDHVLTAPLRWKRPRKIFVNSMGDLFHEDCQDEWIYEVFKIMAASPEHTFQVLTKRAERMREWMTNYPKGWPMFGVGSAWPLPNVWLGVSVECQKEALERIPHLLFTPAAVRFISAEPLLGPIDLTVPNIDIGIGKVGFPDLNWVIVGGESGPHSRPFHLEWADEIIEQCRKACVPCFVKQLGSAPMSAGYPHPLKNRKGGDWDEWPDRLRVRQFPTAVEKAEAA